LRFEVPEVEVFGRHLERSVDRLVIGLVTAALIVGSSVLLSRAGTEGLSAAWLLGAVGIVISFANSIWLVASIHRSHRSRD
jgi:ubiquinone biosynthesis protein